MFKKVSLVGAAMMMGATTIIPATPALAGDGYYRDYRGDRYERGDYYRGDRYYEGRRYRDHRRYNGYNCRRSGTTGTIVGAIAGGLLGREVVGRRGDRTAGAIVGAGVGALAGRAIDKSSGRCR